MALKYPDRLESNNPSSYGIVRGIQVSGHKTVKSLSDLYNIPDAILSDSGNNTGNDAIGQNWYVVNEQKEYRLINWDNRTDSSGWEESFSSIYDNINGLSIQEIVPADDKTLRSYELRNANNQKLGVTINVPKDQTIKDIRLSTLDATLSEDGNIVDGTEGIALCISYITSNGAYKLSTIDYSQFIEEKEFGNGLSVENHTVTLKLDPESDTFISLGENGLKLSGIQQALDSVIQDLQKKAITIPFNTLNSLDLSEVLTASECDTFDEFKNKAQELPIRVTEQPLLRSEYVDVRVVDNQVVLSLTPSTVVGTNGVLDRTYTYTITADNISKFEYYPSTYYDSLGNLITGTYVRQDNLKTLNGESLLGKGDITLDLTLYKLVSSLPSTDIDTTKIYLVPSTETGDQNIYIEYVYVNNAWEKLGEYKSEVDLTEYVRWKDNKLINNSGTQIYPDSKRVIFNDTREEPFVPSKVVSGLTLDYKDASSIDDVDSTGSYGVLTYRPWGSDTDFSGGPIHQILFNRDRTLYHRCSLDGSTWSAKQKIIEGDDTVTTTQNGLFPSWLMNNLQSLASITHMSDSNVFQQDTDEVYMNYSCTSTSQNLPSPATHSIPIPKVNSTKPGIMTPDLYNRVVNGLFSEPVTIDLSDSKYDRNTWYPVGIYSSPDNIVLNLTMEIEDNSPELEWGTNQYGGAFGYMLCAVQYRSYYSGVSNYLYNFVNPYFAGVSDNKCMFGQYALLTTQAIKHESSENKEGYTFFIYLRGGGVYQLRNYYCKSTIVAIFEQEATSEDGSSRVAPTTDPNFNIQNAPRFITQNDVLTKDNTSSYTPSSDYNPATKKYVDDSVSPYNDLLKFKPNSDFPQTDVNTLTTLGLYAVAGGTDYNAPSDSQGFVLVSSNGDSNYFTQTYVDSKGRFWSRGHNASGYSEWAYGGTFQNNTAPISIDSGVITQALEPGRFYVFSGESKQLTLTLQDDIVGQTSEYQFQFTSGASPTALILPDTIKWIGDHEIYPNTTYQVSIQNNIAVMGGC